MYFVWESHRERETGLWLLGGRRYIHIAPKSPGRLALATLFIRTILVKRLCAVKMHHSATLRIWTRVALFAKWRVKLLIAFGKKTRAFHTLSRTTSSQSWQSRIESSNSFLRYPSSSTRDRSPSVNFPRLLFMIRGWDQSLKNLKKNARVS